MKKTFLFRLLVALCTFFIPAEVSAQNAFWDALKIHCMEINGEIDTHPDSTALKAFIADPFENSLPKELLDHLTCTAGTSNLQAVGDAVGLSSTSTISRLIDATALFLAERFQEEATILYLHKFKEKLLSIPGLSDLLPKTTRTLKANKFEYHALVDTYREAFEEDLKNLMGNFKVYLEKQNLPGNTPSNRGLIFSLDLADQLVSGIHPVDILSYLEAEYKDKDSKAYEAYWKIVRGINLLEFNTRQLDKSDENPAIKALGLQNKQPTWISFQDLKQMDTPKELTYFLALLYHQDRVYFNDIFGSLISDPTFENQKKIWHEFIAPGIKLLNKLDVILSEPEIKPPQYVELMDITLSLLKLVNQQFSGIQLPEVALEVLDRTIDIYQSIHERNYAYLVTNGTWIIDTILRETGKTNEDILKITAPLVKYGSFMVDIVTAEDAEAVKEAIKRNITTFSYLDKRRSAVSFTLMGLPSVLVGREELHSAPNSWKTNLGISAPIGFDLSFGRRKKVAVSNAFNPEAVSAKADTVKESTGAAWGFFFGLADIGAPFSYRLNDTVSTLPEEITLEQIFSPSFAVHHSFKNTPLTTAVGIQHTPKLRSITPNNPDERDNTFRFLLRISWDIPMVKIGAAR